MEQFRCYGCMQLISEPVCPHCGHPAGGVNFPHQLPVGTVLAGRYLVGRAINQTQSALVYIALDQNQDKTVLVCEYFPGNIAFREGAQVRPGDGAAFSSGLDARRREASVLAGAEELAQVSGTLDAFEENGTVYLVMDQIRGPGLELYIRRRGGALEAQEALRILRGVVGAIAVLHQSGCAHGSIGLNRIVLDPMGGARLLGFGETEGGDQAGDVLALCRLICDCVVPGAEPSQIPGLTEQQQMALHMGTRPDPQERFNSAVALRRALFGEVTPPPAPLPPLPEIRSAPAREPEAVPGEPAAVEEIPAAAAVTVPVEEPVPEVMEAVPEMPKTEAIVSGVLPEMPKTEAIVSEVLPEMPKTEAIVSEVLPEMPRTEAMVSEVLPSAVEEGPEAEPVVPERPSVEPFQVSEFSRMPATEIVSEFKIQHPVSQQPQPEPAVQRSLDPQPEPVVQRSLDPQPEPAARQGADPQPAFEMPRTEQAPGNTSGWESQPQWSQEPQWQAPPPKKKSGMAIGIIVGAVAALIAALVICFLFVHVWRDATCEEPRTCIFCGKTEGSTLSHKWKDPTCEEPETCKNCGKTQGDALGHAWAPATCQAPKTCTTCGAAEGSAMPHSWLDATCESPKTCLLCGAAEGDVGGHTWRDATCLDPKYCTTCGETSGSALGHSWKEATYTDPETCSRCGETQGEPKGYMEYVSGQFQRFTWGNSNTSCYVLDAPVKNCRGFTLYFEPTFNYNAWVEDWNLLYQDTSGTWHEYGSFTLNTENYEHVFNFSPKLNIKAVAVVPRINGSYSYSFTLGVWYVYYTN